MLGNNFCGDIEYGAQEIETLYNEIPNVQAEVFYFEPGEQPGGDRGTTF